jgi:hypothetical protein
VQGLGGIATGLTGQRVGQRRGVQPGQHGINEELFDGFGDYRDPAAAAVIGARCAHKTSRRTA